MATVEYLALLCFWRQPRPRICPGEGFRRVLLSSDLECHPLQPCDLGQHPSQAYDPQRAPSRSADPHRPCRGCLILRRAPAGAVILRGVSVILREAYLAVEGAGRGRIRRRIDWAAPRFQGGRFRFQRGAHATEGRDVCCLTLEWPRPPHDNTLDMFVYCECM